MNREDGRTPQVSVGPETTIPVKQTPQVPETTAPVKQTPQVPVTPETTIPVKQTPQVPETTVPVKQTPQIPVTRNYHSCKADSSNSSETRNYNSRKADASNSTKTGNYHSRKADASNSSKTRNYHSCKADSSNSSETRNYHSRKADASNSTKTGNYHSRKADSSNSSETGNYHSRKANASNSTKTGNYHSRKADASNSIRPETTIPVKQTPQVPLRPETTFPPVKIPQKPTTFPPVQTPTPEPQETTTAVVCEDGEDSKNPGCKPVEVTTPAPTTDSEQIITRGPQKDCVTRWFSMDKPSGIGDIEILLNVMDMYPEEACFDPTAMEIQTLDGIPASETGQVFVVNNASFGVVCINSMQKKGEQCLDYQVRFTCPPYFCSGEVHTTPEPECGGPPAFTPTPELVQTTPEIPVKGNEEPTTPGPAVVTRPAPTCNPEPAQTTAQTTPQVPVICKTRWFNQDNPEGNGDHELLTELRQVYSRDICPEPTDIEAQTVNGIPASETGQKFAV
nr:mucin-2-like [Anolis sagrei ordinatus]